MPKKDAAATMTVDIDGLPPENIAGTLAREIKALGRVDIVPLGPAEAPVWLASIPEGRTVRDLTQQFDARRPAPRALVQEVRLVGLDSFVAYVERFRDPARSVVFLEPWPATKNNSPSVVAVLDYHASPTQPGWGRHFAQMPLSYSARWLAWSQQLTFNQAALASFLEDNLTDLTTPPSGSSVAVLAERIGCKVGTPAEVLAASRGLQVTMEAQVRDAVQLANGTVQASFVENQTAGSVEVPGLFAVSVPVFEGGADYLLGIRVRYRVVRATDGSGARVEWSLRPSQADRLIEHARDELADTLRQRTQLLVYLGQVYL